MSSKAILLGFMHRGIDLLCQFEQLVFGVGGFSFRGLPFREGLQVGIDRCEGFALL